MTGFQKRTNDRPQNEAGTFALRLAVEKTETIGPSDHANQRNQVTSPGPAGAGLAGPAGTPCCWLVRRWASWQGMQTLHRGLDREGKDSVDGRQGDDDGRLALQQPTCTTKVHTVHAHSCSTVLYTVGYCWVSRSCDDTCYPLVQVPPMESASLSGRNTVG